jgi:hypothetical protein
MIEKPRRFDLYPDDFIAGVAGELTPPEMGVYSMVILLCYSHGGSIPYDPELLRNKFRPSTGGWAIKRHLDRLIAIGKVVRDRNEITVSRVRDEVERTISRMRVSRENGARGGRPSNKNNGEVKGSGSPARYQSSFINHHIDTVADATVPLVVPQPATEADHVRRATRLAPDWQPSSEDRGYAERKGLDPDVLAEAFRDWWLAKSRDDTKRDWHATWRTWCRREAAGRAGNGSGSRGPGGDRRQPESVIAALRTAFPDLH